ncbi:MAG: cytochrome c biogenesis CcdA family protein [Candidatus Kariarchaeaceae archaeon]
MVSVEVLVLNLLIGLVTAFSPCLFPLLPSYVAVTMKIEQSTKNTLFSSLFLIAGILTVFFSLSLVFDLFSDYLLRNYSSFAKFQAVLFVIAGLLLIRTPSILYKIKLPSRFEAILYSDNPNRNPFIFNFLIGLSYTVIAVPCAAGYFIVVWDTMLDVNFIDQFLIVFAFSLGAGLPFIIMSLYIPQVRAEIVGKIHNASRKISIVMGIILIIVAIWLFSEVAIIPAPSID